MTIEFEEGQPNDEPKPRYVVTGGTETFDYNHTYGSCTREAQVQEYELTDEMVGHNWLEFDTTSDPVRYSGYFHTFGPFFPYTAYCEENIFNRNYRAQTVWMDLREGAFDLVSADGRSISGTWRLEQGFSGGLVYIQESEYTIVRVR